MANKMKIDPEIQKSWEKLSKGKTEANWVAVEFKKVNKDTSLELMGQGEGGLDEISQKLQQFPEKVIFGVIKVKFYDEMAAQKGSPYVKFIYFRFLGTKVSVMTKGFLTPRLGSIDELFPVKHLSYDIDENLTKFDQKSIATDFLRVSDNKVEASSFDFGPNQVYQSQNQKIVNNNKQPKNDYVPKNKQKDKPKVEPVPQPVVSNAPSNNDDDDADAKNNATNDNEANNEAPPEDQYEVQQELQQEEEQQQQDYDNNNDNNEINDDNDHYNNDDPNEESQ